MTADANPAEAVAVTCAQAVTVLLAFWGIGTAVTRWAPYLMPSLRGTCV
jgi:hypothetical protein